MAKYHINDNNESKPCSAKKRGCKFANNPHFETKEEATAYAEELSEKEHTTTKSLKKNKTNSNRAYAIYKKNRNENRGATPLNKDSHGSFFNHSVKHIAITLKISMEEARTKIYEGYAEENGITVEKAKDHFETLKKNRIERIALEKEMKEFYDNNIDSMMEQYQQEHGKLKTHEDFENYREWRDQYVYEEVQKNRSSKDKNQNTLKEMSQEEIEDLDDKLGELSGIKRGSGNLLINGIGFEQYKPNEERGIPRHEVITFSSESDLDYIIYEKNGQFLIKLDYGMLNENGYKPITNELDADNLFRHNEAYEHGIDYTMWEDEATPDLPYEKDFIEQKLGKASEILKKRYNIE